MDQEYKDQYQEINIVDYIKTLRKRKKLILGLFLIFIIGAGVYSFLLAPKIYRVEAVLEIGKFSSSDQMLKEIPNIVEKIKKSNLEIKAVNPQASRLIEMEIATENPEEGEKILKEAGDSILAEHQGRAEAQKELISDKIEKLKERIVLLEEQNKNLEAKIAKTEESLIYYQDSCSQFVLFEIIDRLELKKQELEELYPQLADLEASLSDIRPTKIIKEPTVSSQPIRPKPLFNITIAGALGIFIAVLWALTAEWWRKVKIFIN